MKCLSGIILIGLLGLTYGRPEVTPEKTPDASPSTSSISDLIAQAQSNIETLRKDIQEKFNIPNQEEIINTIKTQSTDLVKNVTNYIQKVSDDVKSNTSEWEFWNQIKEKFNEAVNKPLPDAKDQLSQLQEKLTNVFKVFDEESKKVTKTLTENGEKVQEDIAKLTKQAVELAVQTTQNLDKQLKQLAVTEAPKA